MSATVELSPTGQFILSMSEEILKVWSDRVQEKIAPAKNLKRPIIINTIPAYIKTLAQFISSEVQFEHLGETVNISQEHGGERARLSDYGPSDIISEFQIFRFTLFELIQKHKHKVSERDWLSINQFIDQSIRSSVSSFELIQTQIREQFVATLTHDLRSPLGAAEMAAELIVDELNNPKEIVFLLSKIRSNLKRANRMIQDLLDTTAVRTGGRLKLEIEKIDIFRIVVEVAKQLSLVHGPRFVLHGQSTEGFWDGNYLMRAIENICSNAIKYGARDAPITVNLETVKGRVIVSVHNHGNPIPVEEQETIFRAYIRSHAARSGNQKGWGIGLPLVRAVAEAHGGSVGVTSTVEQGTTFLIDMPLDSRPFQDAPTSN
jgi:signal transduction histidine kinase